MFLLQGSKTDPSPKREAPTMILFNVVFALRVSECANGWRAQVGGSGRTGGESGSSFLVSHRPRAQTAELTQLLPGPSLAAGRVYP